MKKQRFLKGIKDGIPICLGYFSVSMAFGLASVLKGLPVIATVLMSLSNVTSAGQFAGVGILAAGGTFVELAITTLIINIRYFLMSLSVSQKASPSMSLAARFAVSFGITDEIFAVSVQQKEELTGDYMAGLILTPVIGWTLGTLTGAVATSVMPAILTSAMGVALYGMFIAIVVPPARESKPVMFTIFLAVLMSFLFTYVPYINKLSGGWSIIIITVIVSAISATLFPIEQAKGEVAQNE